MTIPAIFDSVKETCSQPGTATVALLGRSSGYQAFATKASDGQSVYYAVRDQNAGQNWECGVAVWHSGGHGTLVRTSGGVEDGSSGPGVLVDFSIGTQDVFITLTVGGLLAYIAQAQAAAETFATDAIAALSTIYDAIGAAATAQTAAQSFTTSSIAALNLGTASELAFDTDAALGANSDTRLPTQKAVRTFVASSIVGLLDLKGGTDCSGNPNFPVAVKGDAYYVTVAGKIGGASGIAVDVGDVYFSIADNAGGTQASVGTSWRQLEHNLAGALLAANNLSDVANAATARTNLGLGSIATHATSEYAATANNLSDLASAPTARNNLGLGTAATHASTDFDAAGSAAAALVTAVSYTDSSSAAAIVTAEGSSCQRASNLSDVASAATSRTNLGLGTAATHASTDFDAAGAAATAQSTAEAFATSADTTVLSTAETFTTNAITALSLGTASTLVFDTDGTLAANSDARIATQKAVKTYVAAQIIGLLNLKGGTDCSANPNYPSAAKGDAYYVTVAGKIGGASGIAVDVGDVYFANAANVGGTQAAVGASWDQLEHNLIGALLAANNLSDVANAGTARTNLGLGTSATHAATDFLLAANNLSDVTASTARTNLGLGTAATHASTDFDAAGAAASAITTAEAASCQRASNLSDVASAVAAIDNIHTKSTGIASATTTDLSTATGDYLHITGTATITAFSSQVAGIERTLVFDGILTLTHNGTSLILDNNGGNIVTAAGDTAVMRSEGSGNWRCVEYSRANGQALQSSSTSYTADESSLHLASTTFSVLGKLVAGGMALLTGAKFVNAFKSTTGTGDVDIYTCPSNKRAMVIRATVYNTSGSTINNFPEWKIGGTYWRSGISGNTTTGAINQYQNMAFILEAGESLSWNTSTTTGLNIFATIVEFDNTCPVKTVVQASTAVRSGITIAASDNTIYTVPAGKTAYLLDGDLLGNSSVSLGNIHTCGVGVSPTCVINIVPSGGSVATTNRVSPSISTGGGVRSSVNISACMGPGDFINATYSGSVGSTSMIWANIIEATT